MRLLVSLPENSVELARAAEAGGADALKVHLNVTHAASGTAFGSWQEEKERIRAIISAVKIPVGVMPGGEKMITPAEWSELVASGIKFVNVLARHFPLWLLNAWEQVELIPALDAVGTEGEAFYLTHYFRRGQNRISCLEAAIIPPEEYGAPLSFQDVARYQALADWADRPLLIPTQKFIQPEELWFLRHEQIAGVILGVIVLGRTPSLLEVKTRSYRAVIDKIISRAK